MSRTMSVLAATAALVLTPFIHAADATADRERPREEAPRVEMQLPAPVRTLASLFAAAEEEETIDVIDGESSGTVPMEVVVARIDADGKLVLSCVDNEAAAKRFLKADLEKLATKEAKEH